MTDFNTDLTSYIDDMFPSLSGEDQVRLFNVLRAWSDEVLLTTENLRGATRLNRLLVQRLGGEVEITQAELTGLPDTARLNCYKNPETGGLKVWLTSSVKH